MARITLATIAMNNMAGGLERNIAYLANHLAETGHEVVLLTFDLPGAKAFYPLDESIAWHCVGRTRPHGRIGFTDRLALIKRVRETLRNPAPCDTLICFHHGILLRCLLASAFLRTRVICSERNALTMYDHIAASKWNLNFLLLFLVDRITVQFPGYREDYPRLLRRKICHVHNPVFPAAPNEEPREPLILSVGRHCAQKRFDLLIRACAIAFRDHPQWQLAIVGDGSLTPRLRDEIDAAGLADRIHLVPPDNDLHHWHERATLYCQPSQWEGFPNAQAEAMAAGVVPVGFAATRGVANLIEHGINGYLCEGHPTEEALAAALAAAMADTSNHDRLSQASKNISTRYSPASWEDCWSKALMFDNAMVVS